MRACMEWNEALIDAVFGELDSTSESRLNEHLAVCAACRVEEEALYRLRDEIAVEVADPHEGLRQRIRSALAPRRRVSPLLDLLLRPIPIYAAVLAVVAGVLLASLRPSTDRSAATPDMTARKSSQDISVVRPLPFHPVGSYDTGVRTAQFEGRSAGTAPFSPSQARDSL